MGRVWVLVALLAMSPPLRAGLIASQPLRADQRCVFAGERNRYAQADRVDSLAFSVELSEQPSNFFVAFGREFELYVQFGERGQGLRVYRDGQVILHERGIETTGGRYELGYAIHDKLRLWRDGALVAELAVPESALDVVRVGTWRVGACFGLPERYPPLHPLPGGEIRWEYFGLWDGGSDPGPGPDPVALDTLRGRNVAVFWDANSEPDVSHYLALLAGDSVRVEHPQTEARFSGLADGDYLALVHAVDDSGNVSAPGRKRFYVLADSTQTPPRDRHDFDGNGMVDLEDFKLQARHLGARAGDGMWRPDMDLHADGVIDVRDLRVWFAYWRAL